MSDTCDTSLLGLFAYLAKPIAIRNPQYRFSREIVTPRFLLLATNYCNRMDIALGRNSKTQWQMQLTMTTAP